MLQLFHFSITKVDLNVRLSSEKERASVGAMAASTGKLVTAPPEDAQGHVCAGVCAPFPYDMLPPLPPPKVLEQNLVAQCGEMQNLAMENDRLATSTP
jgi:hypothetical protein